MSDPNCVDDAVLAKLEEGRAFTQLEWEKERNPGAYITPRVMVRALAWLEENLAKVRDAAS